MSNNANATENQTSMDWEPSAHPASPRTRGLKRRSSEHVDNNRAKKKCNEPATIHQLPNELLLEIFEKMNQATLKECLLVNRNWKQIISQSVSTMTKLPLIITDENLENGRSFPKLTRRYNCVTLDEVYACDNDLLKEFKTIGQHVKKLNLNDCIFFEKDFIKLNRCFPNLESLTIRWCSMGLMPARRTRAKPAEMKHLKKLVIWGEGWMLKNLNCHQLETLTLSRFYVDDQRELVKFLNAQSSLKSLRLNDINDMFSTRNRREKIMLDLKFQLRDISLWNLDFVDANHLLTLLQRAEKCEKAFIGHNVPAVIAREAVKKFHNLKCLYIDADHLSDYNYSNLKHNTKLKCLKIGGILDTPSSLLGFVSIFPNVENLNLLHLEGLASTNEVLWRSMSATLTKVRTFQIQRFNVFNMVLLKFPLMTSCTIDMLGYTNLDSWSTFGVNNPTIHTMIIRSTPLQIFFGADVMITVKSLRQLEYYRSDNIGPHNLFALH